MEAVALFDAIGPAYEDAFSGSLGQTAAVEWMTQELKAKTRARFLDIGCGTGRPTCAALVEDGHDVLGIDISNEMLAAARKNVPGAKFERVDVKLFDAEDESFDGITVFFGMIAEFSQDEIRSHIAKIHKWLKRGGSFVFATVPLDGNNVRIKWLGRSVLVSSLTEDQVLEWFMELGFDVVFHETEMFTPVRAPEVGLCTKEDVWEEPQLYVYARKK
jgi:cyclopropane fatty-acyl-phospholipid synthase-like methyltransferase